MSDPTGTDRIALEALGLWDGTPGSLLRVGESENEVFRFSTGLEARYLRLVSADRRPLEQVEAELEFVSHLAAGGAGVCPALQSANGRLIETFLGPAGALYASSFNEAEGEAFEFGAPEDNLAHFRLRGRALGRIHALSRTFRPSTDARRFAWDQEPCLTHAARHVPKSETAVWREHRELSAWLADRPRDEPCYGLIHGDFGATNYRQLGDRLTVFDFDDCCYHWYAYDLAVAIYPHGWRAEAGALLAALLAGYSETAAGPVPAPGELQFFCRLRLLYMFLTYARKWGFADLSERQVRWFARTRDNIVRGYRFGGAGA